MNTEKVKAGVKVCRRVIDLVDKIADAELLMSLNGKLDQQDQKVFDEVEKWANLISGNMSGYAQELDNFYRYRIQRSREVQRGKFADITITDPKTGVAKAIQLKSTNQDDAGSVTGMIKEAANQLSGERGETPLDTHRRVIDMAIRSPDNTWPFNAWTPRGNCTCPQLIKQAESVIAGAMTDYLPHGTIKINTKTSEPNKQPSAGTGLSPTAFGKLTDISKVGQIGRLHDSKTAFHSNATTNPQLVIGVTVKIRFLFPYKVVDTVTQQNTTYRWIDSLAFECNRRGTQLVTTHVKTKWAQ